MSLLKSILNMVLKTAADSLNEREERPTRTTTSTTRVAHLEEEEKDESYFAEILRTQFPQYSVRRNVKVTELAGNTADEFKLYPTRPQQTYRAEWGQPYTFVLYLGATPSGVVMLGSGSSHSKNVKYLIARMYAKKLGLPYINFYLQFPNERAYVVERIQKLMNA